MASAIFLRNILCISHRTAQCYQKEAVVLNHPCQFLSSESLSRLKKQSLLSTLQIKISKTHKFQAVPAVFAAQSNFLKVLQTVWKVGKDGIEAGTNLVPDTVPRPVARISVTAVAVALVLFVLKSVLSTAFFVLDMYHGVETRVRTCGGDTEPFTTTIGLHQGNDGGHILRIHSLEQRQWSKRRWWWWRHWHHFYRG